MWKQVRIWTGNTILMVSVGTAWVLVGNRQAFDGDKRVTRSANKIHLKSENWTNFIAQIVYCVRNKVQLANWPFPQGTLWTNNKLNKISLRSNIDQYLFNWAQSKPKPQWIQTTMNLSHRCDGCDEFLHPRGTQRPRGVGDLAPWPKAREIWAKPAATFVQLLCA